jgi:AAA15 family ATPase/GTPase
MFSTLEVGNLNPITILVGQNNTGKSSLLEAISLATSAKFGWRDFLGNDLLDQIILRRGGYAHMGTMIRIGQNQALIGINQGKSNSKLEITRNLSNITEESFRTKILENLFTDLDETSCAAINNLKERSRQDYTSVTSVLQSDIFSKTTSFDTTSEIAKYEAEVPRIKQRLYEAISLVLAYAEKREVTQSAILLEKQTLAFFSELMLDAMRRYSTSFTENKHIIRYPQTQEKSHTVFLLDPNVQYIKELQERLTLTGDLIRVINLMKGKIDYFEDIREVNGSFMVFIKGLKRPVPLEAMGEGFRAKLAMLAAIHTIENGVILMEEPESHLHPGYMGTISDEIVNTAKGGNIQYFISTHSLDFLESILKTNTSLVSVLRLRRAAENHIDLNQLTGQEALDEMEKLELDLRGV